MATEMMAWLVAIPLLGAVTGLRTMMPMTVLCWFAYFQRLPVEGTWARWTAHLVSALVFSVLAVGELIGDKLPQTPDRTSPGPLVARLTFAGLMGAIVATALEGPGLEGVILGVVGAVAGAFGGYHARRALVEWLACPDLVVAVVEDALAIFLAVAAMRVITA